MKKTYSYHEEAWKLQPGTFDFPDYLEFQKALKDQFRWLKKIGISENDLREVWEKCRVKHLSFTNWLPGRKYAEIIDDKHGAETGYFIEIEWKEPEEIKAAIRQLPLIYREARGIKIKPSKFYRVLFFYQVAHTVSRCGRFLFEFLRIKATDKFWRPGERYRFERKAWLWAVKMASRKHPEIRILYRTADKKKKLKFHRWMLKQDKIYRKELAEREKTLKKAA
jgi:hypothetical protein